MTEPSFPFRYLFMEVSAELATRKRAAGLCVKYRCRRRAAKKSGGKCNTCASRMFRYYNPVEYAYHNLKSSARKRKIAFNLSFQEFCDFASDHGYIEGRGRQPYSLTIDRINTKGPYSIDNIRILSHADNSSHKFEQTPDDGRHPFHD
jgi:hypothetical protein